MLQQMRNQNVPPKKRAQRNDEDEPIDVDDSSVPVLKSRHIISPSSEDEPPGERSQIIRMIFDRECEKVRAEVFQREGKFHFLMLKNKRDDFEVKIKDDDEKKDKSRGTAECSLCQNHEDEDHIAPRKKSHECPFEEKKDLNGRKKKVSVHEAWRLLLPHDENGIPKDYYREEEKEYFILCPACVTTMEKRVTTSNEQMRKRQLKKLELERKRNGGKMKRREVSKSVPINDEFTISEEDWQCQMWTLRKMFGNPKSRTSNERRFRELEELFFEFKSSSSSKDQSIKDTYVRPSSTTTDVTKSSFSPSISVSPSNSASSSSLHAYSPGGQNFVPTPNLDHNLWLQNFHSSLLMRSRNVDFRLLPYLMANPFYPHMTATNE